MATSADFQARYLQLAQTSPYLAGIIRPNRQVLKISWYVYNGRIGSDAIPLAPGVAQSDTFDTQADSDFVCTFIEACVQEVANGAMAYNDNVDLQVQDLSSGKLWFSTPTALALVTGAGGFPYKLPAPRVIAPNTSIRVTSTNHDTIVNGGLGPVGVNYALHGSRIFYGQ